MSVRAHRAAEAHRGPQRGGPRSGATSQRTAGPQRGRPRSGATSQQSARSRRPRPQRRVRSQQPLVLALPKGRILDEAAALFQRAGYDLGPVFDGSRKLVYDCGPLRVLVLRSSDVPAYVSHGAAQVGIVGSDVLDEQVSERHALYEPLDLGFGACRMIVAERADRPVDGRAQLHLCIATKYPNITRRYLERSGQTAEIIELAGAIELAPLTGLADRIVDITQTGETLRQNGLVEVDTITQVTSRLIVNPAALKLDGERIAGLIDRLERALHESAPSAAR
jgi:ATP phosphoribosyltransferase